MKHVANLLNSRVSEGIIKNYAVFGAVAQMRYTEAIVTFDVDVLIAVSNPTAIDSLHEVYSYCRERSYYPAGEAIMIGDWPVQFTPVFSHLTEEALEHAEIGDIDGAPFRAVRADYLAVIALSVGRAKDFARILALQEAKAVQDDCISLLAARHGLSNEWQLFRERFYGTGPSHAKTS